jgi:hypothetical protein
VDEKQVEELHQNNWYKINLNESWIQVNNDGKIGEND